MAEGLVQLYRGSLYPRARPLAVSLVILCLLSHLVIGGYGLRGVLHNEVPDRTAHIQAAHALTRLGMHPPCLVYGHKALQTAYYARCAARNLTGGLGGGHTPAPLSEAMTRGQQVVVVAHQARAPALFLRGWPRVRLTGPALQPWYAYLPPGTTQGLPGGRQQG